MADFAPTPGSRAGHAIKAILNLLPLFTSLVKGVVPKSGGGTTNFLRADGTWAAPAGSSGLTVGTTTIASGTTKGLLYDNAAVLGNLATANSGVLVTDGSGNPSISTTIPNGVAATTQAAGDNTTAIATDAFVTTAVNNAIAGVNPAVAVQAATTAASNTSGFTYSNGVGGIGATFTGSVNTAVTIDGFTFTALGQRLLVKNDTQSPSGAFNGIYYVTQIQTSLLAPILTRALDYDQPSDMNNTGAIPVINGTVNATTSWLLTSSVVTVGTTPLTYVQFSLAPPAFSSYSVADASGAGLTFTVTTAQYYTVGKMVFVFLQFSYPGTANGSTAKISLPFASDSAVGNTQFGFCYVSSQGGTNAYQVLTGANAFEIDNLAATVSYTNANLSGATILCQLTYKAA